MKKIDVKTKKLFDLEETVAKELFERYTYPWEVFKELGSFIEEVGATLPDTEYLKIGKNIWVHRSVKIMPTVALAGPLIIGKDASIRSCAFFRGNVIIGEGYVGDSIIGYKAHLGASAITSNLKSDKSDVVLHLEDAELETGLRKLGAIVGDEAEVGCGSILNPGTVIGKNTTIYPLSSVRGCVSKSSIYKSADDIVTKAKKKPVVNKL